ncbi:MAG: hypothetical protein GY854_26725 [Deltaproteobacteria bacterium]|nr:hypothetical protein [Deltaproteobacteria bacterium]
MKLKDWNPFDYRGVQLTLLIVVPAVAAVLLGAGLRVASYWNDEMLIVHGQRQLVAGWPSAMRFTLMNNDSVDIDLIKPARITGHLVRGEHRTLLFDGPVAHKHDSVPRNFKVPSMTPGPAQIELAVELEGKRRHFRMDVEILSQPPPEATAIAGDAFARTEGYKVALGESEIALFTEDRAAPLGLESTVFLRVTDDLSDPREIGLAVELPDSTGMANTRRICRTDSLGLIALPIRPIGIRPPLTALGAIYVNADFEPLSSGTTEEITDASLYPEVMQSGISVAIAEPIVRAGEPLRLTISSMANRGPIHIDLFHRGRLAQAFTTIIDGTETDIELKSTVSGLIRVRLTDNALVAESDVASRNIYVLKDGEDVDQGLARVLHMLADSGRDTQWARVALALVEERETGIDRQRAAAFSLSQIDAGRHGPDVLLHSRKEEREKHAALTAWFQGASLTALLLLVLGIALQVGTMAMGGYRRRQRDRTSSAGDTLVPLLRGSVALLLASGSTASVAILCYSVYWGFGI